MDFVSLIWYGIYTPLNLNGKNDAQKVQAKLGYVNEVKSNLRTLAGTSR